MSFICKYFSNTRDDEFLISHRKTKLFYSTSIIINTLISYEYVFVLYENKLNLFISKHIFFTYMFYE